MEDLLSYVFLWNFVANIHSIGESHKFYMSTAENAEDFISNNFDKHLFKCLASIHSSLERIIFLNHLLRIYCFEVELVRTKYVLLGHSAYNSFSQDVKS